jgi:type II secretory pathway pseudopilin PulG
VLAGEPRVQLLPPSVKEREKNRAARRMMGLLVVLAVVISGAGTGFTFWLTTQTEAQLAEAQAQTLQILAEQSEYSAGAQVAAQVAGTQDALQTVTTNEIDWMQLSAEVLAYLPCDCQVAELSVTGPAPWEPELIPEGPLRPSRVASMTITIESSTYSNAGDFVRAVRTLAGVADAVITTTSLEEALYKTQIVVTFDAKVLALRYAAASVTPGEETEGDDMLVDAGATPAPLPTEGTVP